MNFGSATAHEAWLKLYAMNSIYRQMQSVKIICLALFCCGVNFLSAQANSQNFEIKSLYKFAIQEDVKSILLTLDTIADSRLSVDDKVLKQKYIARFVTGNEIYNHGITDKTIRDIIDIYRGYWTSILLKNKTVKKADSVLINHLCRYFTAQQNKNSKTRKTITPGNLDTHFTNLLTEKGYFNNVTGKTGNLYDIYIWKKQDTVNYEIQLPDGHINVAVLFMNDIITLGWEEYATFGNVYPGGWPANGALYCVAKAYDSTQEKFLVSYLAHEAQHFLDLKNYNTIPSWQLEYRAKLAELSKADKTMEKLIGNFIKGGKNDSTLTHPYAEYCVIRDLSNEIFNGDIVSSIDQWKLIRKTLINEVSATLLKRNTEAIRSLRK